MGLYLLEWLCVCKVSDCQSTTFIHPFAELGIATSRPGSKQCMTQKLPFSISTPSSQCTLQVRCLCDMVGSMASLSLLSGCCDSNGLTVISVAMMTTTAAARSFAGKLTMPVTLTDTSAASHAWPQSPGTDHATVMLGKCAAALVQRQAANH